MIPTFFVPNIVKWSRRGRVVKNITRLADDDDDAPRAKIDRRKPRPRGSSLHVSRGRANPEVDCPQDADDARSKTRRSEASTRSRLQHLRVFSTRSDRGEECFQKRPVNVSPPYPAQIIPSFKTSRLRRHILFGKPLSDDDSIRTNRLKPNSRRGCRLDDVFRVRREGAIFPGSKRQGASNGRLKISD